MVVFAQLAPKSTFKITLLTPKNVSEIIKRQRTALRKDIANGLVTKPVKYGARSIVWPSYEIEQIAMARVAGWSDDQLRELVAQLHAQRKDCVPASTYVEPAVASPGVGGFEPAFAGA